MATCTSAVVSPDELAGILACRDGVIKERPGPDDRGPDDTGPDDTGPDETRFIQADGPVADYERVVRVEARPDGRALVTQTVRMRVGVPGFSWLFVVPLRHWAGRLDPPARSPWWAPPARLSRRAAVVLATLCLLAIVVGYLGDLLADTLTYAGTDFHVGDTGQGVALGIVEAGAVGALVLLAVADRRSRRPVLVASLLAGSAVSALGAAVPDLALLTATQLVAASLVGAAGILIAVIAVEELPPGSRAWGIGLIAMCTGLGSGATLGVLPLADFGRAGWRWPFAIALVGIPLTLWWARTLPTASPPPAAPMAKAAGRTRRTLDPDLRRRLLILGAGALLLTLFSSPAGSFQNQFLHHERHLSATRISLLEQLSGTIGGLGTLVGGRLADTWGRRPIAALGVALGTVLTLLHYTSHGTLLWVWNTAGSVVSYGVGPALGVYGAELFPATVRARAGGVLTVLGAAGGGIGLGVGGAMASGFGSIAPALGVLAVAPAAVVVLILVGYPETAGVPLDVLNPADLLPGRPGPDTAPPRRPAPPAPTPPH